MATEPDPKSGPQSGPKPHAQGASAPREAGSSAKSFEHVWSAQGGLGDGGWDVPERFELTRDLGDGLGGPVFVVRDSEHGGEPRRFEVVSSRHTPDEAAKAALEEALRAAGRVDSPNVVRALEVGRLSDGRIYSLSQFTEGEPLAAVLARERSFHADHALEIARQVLRGLEAIHAAGLAHGGLSDTTVWLALGVPKTDSDPFGVRASISDLGLARWISPQVQPSADVAAVGELLAQMLGEAAAGEQKRFDAARAVADGARGRGAARYESALQMRMAIDALLERARRSEPARVAAAASEGGSNSAWAKPAFAAAALGCCALAWFGWSQRKEVQAAEFNASSKREGVERARDLAEQALAEAQARAGQLESQVDEVSAALATERERVAADKQLAEAQTGEAQRSLAAERARAEELAQSLTEQREHSAQVEAELRRVSQLVDESVRAARGFDSTLEMLENGRAAEAPKRAALLESEGLFGPSTSFVSDLANAYADLERFEGSRSSGEIDVVAVRDAAASAARAREQRATFVEEGDAWLALTLMAAPQTPRIERLDSALAELGRRLAAAEAERDQLHAAEWEAIDAGPGIQDPALAFRHSERFSCAHLDELGERFARELRSWVLVGGALDVDRLNTFHQLASWTERVDRGQVQLPAELASDLRLLAHAQRWYDLDPGNDARMDLSEIAPRTPSRAAKDWRSELSLEWRLAQPDSEYPVTRGKTHWYRSVDADGQVEWWRESADSVDADGWRVRRALFSADGEASRGEGEIVIEHRDGKLAIAGSNLPLLDLHARGDAVMVGPIPASEPVQAPAALGLDPAQVDAFRAANRDEACLIYTQGDVRRWVSPRLGLVREETRTSRGWSSVDLVWIAP